MKKLRFSHVLSDYILNLSPLEIVLILYMYMYMLFLLFCMFIKRIDVCSSDRSVEVEGRDWLQRGTREHLGAKEMVYILTVVVDTQLYKIFKTHYTIEIGIVYRR